MNAKVKVEKLDVLMILLSTIQFPIVPNKVFVIYRYFVVVLELVRYKKEILKNKKLVMILSGYTVVLAYSTIINTYSITWVISALMQGTQYIVFFCVFSRFTKKHGSCEIVNLLISILGVLLLFTDSLMLVIPYNFFDADEFYWVGNKFLVSYYHCLLACLLYIKYNNSIKRIYSFVAMCYTIFVAACIHCTTGIIIAIVIVALMCAPKKLKLILQKPVVFISALAIENVLIWGTTSIFQTPIVVNLVTNIFHKSADMTGRARLYAVTLELVEKSPWWGYGHNTDVYRDLFGYGNAQNGLFHIVTQAGIVGAILYFCAVYAGIKKAKDDHTLRSYGLYMYIYGMLVGSAIEINLSTAFLLGVAVIYALNLNYQRRQMTAKK